MQLADGCIASIGDTIITRTNDRRLRISRTDWVKNSDRWTITATTRRGDIQAQHAPTGRLVTLPHDYVAASVELGYATTIHTAQGVSVDTMHGVATGQETRQQFYTMMTRGRHANHVWLQVVNDGDDATLIRPEGASPLTSTDILENILGRDEAPASATTLLRDQADPHVLLGEATQRYLDGLYLATEHHLGADNVTEFDAEAAQLLPGLVDAPAWPTLRAHLMLVGAQGNEPLQVLQATLDSRELGTAIDPAAVLSWRLDPTGLRGAQPGPLPWIPGIPTALVTDPVYGDWLTQRANLVADLAVDVRNLSAAASQDPSWVPRGVRHPNQTLIGEIEVWRAAMQVEPGDMRPTGPTQLGVAAINWQRHLKQQLQQGTPPAMAEWGPTLYQLGAAVQADEYLPQLADNLAGLARNGHPAAQILAEATSEGPLPDDHAAAALWWRIRHLLPHAPDLEPTAWIEQLSDLIGETHAHQLTESPYWPALVQQVDEALERGWQVANLLTPTAGASATDDLCLVLLNRAATLNAGPGDHHEDPRNLPPDDAYEDWKPPETSGRDTPKPSAAETYDLLIDDFDDTEAELGFAALWRNAMGAPELTDADIAHQLERADAWRASPCTRERLVHINQLTQSFYADRFPNSWAQTYLAELSGADLTGHELVQPGHAPTGWTTLVNHLRHQGITDTEMLTAGVARTASTGNLIDHFRDRLTFPITNPDGEILGFVGRRHPDSPDGGKDGPKYLNTAETPLFHKADQYYGTLSAGSIPVIVEGPLDAIAITLGSAGRYTGLAPLGTALSDQQAAMLLGQPDVVIATDADLAGHVAAERDYWQLTSYGLNPRRATFTEGTDPADLLSAHGTGALVRALDAAEPMAHTMMAERITNLSAHRALDQTAQIIAARPPDHWDTDTRLVAEMLDVNEHLIREALVRHTQAWNQDPRATAARVRHTSTDVRRRLEAANKAQRWAEIADQADPRLTTQPDWPALARTIQHAHEAGYDAETAVRMLSRPDAESARPAADLRARLAATLNLNEDANKPRALANAARDRRREPIAPPQPPTPATPHR